MLRNYLLFISLLSFLLIACDDDSSEVKPDYIGQLTTQYEQLPEAVITVDLDSTVYAQYTMPTERYRHGIMGDRVEGGQLVVIVDNEIYELTLPEEYVFEDIRPRIYDVDNDGQLEFICIRSHRDRGAGIVIYKIVDEQLIEYATIAEIDKANRWLNIVAIDNLDDDETIEIVWIQTPHIGGILKVAKIMPGQLAVLDPNPIAIGAGYSNHTIGSRNLCLSVLTEQSNQKVFYVPNQSRDKIVGFSFQNNQFQLVEEIVQTVDFAKSLSEQFEFTNLIVDQINCINP